MGFTKLETLAGFLLSARLIAALTKHFLYLVPLSALGAAPNAAVSPEEQGIR